MKRMEKVESILYGSEVPKKAGLVDIVNTINDDYIFTKRIVKWVFGIVTALTISTFSTVIALLIYMVRDWGL